jgi:hypothetical protein
MVRGRETNSKASFTATFPACQRGGVRDSPRSLITADPTARDSQEVSHLHGTNDIHIADPVQCGADAAPALAQSGLPPNTQRSTLVFNSAE